MRVLPPAVHIQQGAQLSRARMRCQCQLQQRAARAVRDARLSAPAVLRNSHSRARRRCAGRDACGRRPPAGGAALQANVQLLVRGGQPRCGCARVRAGGAVRSRVPRPSPQLRWHSQAPPHAAATAHALPATHTATPCPRQPWWHARRPLHAVVRFQARSRSLLSSIAFLSFPFRARRRRPVPVHAHGCAAAPAAHPRQGAQQGGAHEVLVFINAVFILDKARNKVGRARCLCRFRYLIMKLMQCCSSVSSPGSARAQPAWLQAGVGVQWCCNGTGGSGPCALAGHGAWQRAG